MSPQCLPSSFSSPWLTVWEEMWIEEFQAGAILDTGTEAILNFHNTPMPQSCLSSIRLTIWKQIWFEDFHNGCHGCHLGYQNRTILAILNLHAAPMPSTTFPLNLTYCSGADNNWRLSRWLEKMLLEDFQDGWHGSHLWYWNRMILAILNLHGPNASHHVWAQSDLGFQSRCGFKIFKMVAQAASLDSQTERFKQFWISMSLWCFPSSFGSTQLTVWEEMSTEEFQDVAILDTGPERF